MTTGRNRWPTAMYLCMLRGLYGAGPSSKFIITTAFIHGPSGREWHNNRGPRYKTLSRGVDGVPGADTKGVDATVQLFVAGALVVRSLRLDPGGGPEPRGGEGEAER